MYQERNSIITTPITTHYTSFVNPSPDINFVTEEDGQIMMREDNTFLPGSYLKVKITTPITDNRYRLIAMDYVMVITDPYENIVFLDIIKNRSRSYIRESSAIFSKRIPAEWLDGEYMIELYSYDRVDTTELKDVDYNIYEDDDSMDDLSEFFDQDPSDDVLEDLHVLNERSHSTVVKDTLTFFMNKNSNPVKVQNLSVNQNVIPINSTVLVTAQLENTISGQTNATYQLFLNDRPIKSLDSVMGSREWQTLNVDIFDAPAGENKVQLGSKTVYFTVSDIPLGPAELEYLDISTKPSRLYAGQHFDLSVSVLNTGGKGSVPTVLLVNDQEIIQNVQLNYGEKKTIDYPILISEPGTYTARIIGTELSKVLFIQEIPQVIEQEEKKSPIFIFAIVFYALLLVLIALGWLRYRRSRHSPEPPTTEKLKVDSCRRIKVILSQIVPDTVARHKCQQSKKDYVVVDLGKKWTLAYTLLEKCPYFHYASTKIENTFNWAYNELNLSSLFKATNEEPIEYTMENTEEVTDHTKKTSPFNVFKNKRHIVRTTSDLTISDLPAGPLHIEFVDMFFSGRCRFYAGDIFKIFVTVINTGSKGKKPIVISVNNEKICKDVALDHGEKKTIEYELLIHKSGVYTARIVGTNLSKNFFIQKKTAFNESLHSSIAVNRITSM